jgi:cardiolipin synthase (CMP-forming)
LKGPFLSLPNCMSIARVPLSLLAAVLLVRREVPAAVIVATVAILSDWLDGALARSSGSESEWGRILDPVADKIGFLAFGIALVVTGGVPLWLLLVVAGRDALIALGGLLLLRRKPEPPRSNIPGKLSSLVLSVYMIRQAVAPVPGTVLGLDWLGLAALAAVVAGFLGYIPRMAPGQELEA